MSRAARMVMLAGLPAMMLTAVGQARAQELIADLSDHLVQITTGFTGSKVLLFGAIEGAGDVVVVVRGPISRAVVRRKGRVAGVWVNQERAVFDTVPAFYFVSSSRPTAEFLPPAVAARHQIGSANLRLGGTHNAYSEALIRNQVRRGLYGASEGQVAFMGQRLFRTLVEFPANVPTGSYTVEVYLIRDGEIAGAQTTPLEIRKAGLEAEIFQFAHRYAVYYGLIAIVLALMAGWAAGVIFRRT